MFSPIKNVKVYEQVIEQIKAMIANGTLKKGDKLPSERDMAENLKISRASIREALRALEIIGLVESRQGDGNFIRESFENGLFQPLSVMFMLQESKPEEILELRRIIEVETAALASQNISDEELVEIGLLVEQLKNSIDEDERVVIDRKFHYKIAQASGNFLILNILNAISSLMESFIKDARKKILERDDNKEILFKQHENIYKALERHDASEAAVAMRYHLKFANEYMIK